MTATSKQARYLDEALEQFFKELKEAGLYDNSVIMIYGDHNGISENHNRAMKEDSWKRDHRLSKRTEPACAADDPRSWQKRRE
ncbi:sulfatase-like hydrolase/transferase [Bacillus subtilis]|nr:sulfatase-like hydrolase/transferase [Bacillus subtilis]WOA23151.1 sulfatase-like hydrolase/transferase [Bacillus subtilis]